MMTPEANKALVREGFESGLGYGDAITHQIGYGVHSSRKALDAVAEILQLLDIRLVEFIAGRWVGFRRRLNHLHLSLILRENLSSHLHIPWRSI